MLTKKSMKPRNVLVLGLGQFEKGSGISAALFYAQRGDRVTIMDFYYTDAMAANAARLKKFKNVRCIFNRHDLKAIRGADVVVKHQRIRMNEPEVREAARLGIPLESELSIFLTQCPARVIGVTGTRGKSTTTALVAAMLKAGAKRRVWLGGNILISPLAFLSKIKRNDIVVLEMSSFQLEGTGYAGVSPPVAVWTNIMTDHLNAYSGMEEYAEAKAQIFRHQQPNDVVFLPADRSFDLYAAEAPGRVVRVGKRGQPEVEIAERTRLRLRGEHNVRNAEFAAAVAREFGVTKRAIIRALKTFPGLPGRLECVAEIRGVRFVNDTTATTPDATIAAIRALAPDAKTIRLIAGGADKELEFDAVAKEIKRRRVLVSLFEGTAFRKFSAALKRASAAYERVPDMKTALDFHLANARKGDVILLSPGCASFGLFKNEFDRGEQFKRIVKRWK